MGCGNVCGMLCGMWNVCGWNVLDADGAQNTAPIFDVYLPTYLPHIVPCHVIVIGGEKRLDGSCGAVHL